MASFLELVTAQIGTPYIYGGDTPGGFDCSGLVQWAAGAAGIQGVPRVSSEQFRALGDVPGGVPTPGDLVFFDTSGVEGGPQPGHVGVVANVGGTTMIDAPHTGTLVGLHSIDGYGPVMGYKRLPGTPAQISGSGGTTAVLTGITDIIPSPSDILGGVGDVAGEVVKPIGDLIAQIPKAFLEVLFGGHTITEIALRTLEVLGGALLIGTGGVLIVKVIAESGGEPERVARSVRRTGRQAARSARSAQRSAKRAAGPRKGAQGATKATRAAKAAVPRTRHRRERPTRPELVGEPRRRPTGARELGRRTRGPQGVIDVESRVRRPRRELMA